ncbi:nucleotide disphospho-sugar-binding domain-containing protein [Kutzneria buriramensis]|uniref:UDP:flavonoid glycosyltransferase YjiC (YdhE family) n=1 Tax=Kutzneria buriramensis TaxID=1045776 RepID=A0A3E0I038_9PSEU|nr:nucleotide disphospho-sugar-binding domain-containing protein [Kutzneria buriramensis]REH51906.1 UDP:flavonoid glycosyltransferase YjiC (YdhE family) [Kutzneria buriramensis]
MRVLVVSAPGVGHVFPMVPLTWALRASGHDVLVATSSDALAVADAGLPVTDALPGVDIRQQMMKMREENPAYFQELLSRRITDVREMGAFMPVLSRPLLPGVLAVAERFRPDVIVQGLLGGVGLIAAAKLGTPWVGHGFGMIRGDGVPEAFREHMAAEFEEHGVELPERRAYVDVAPPSMLAGEPEGWSMRYVPYNGGGVEPEWLGEVGDRPRVAVTLGTVAPQMNGLGPVERVIEAAPDVDADFVVALGDKVDVSGLGTLPSNVHVAGWIPLNSLLATSSLLIHHGGAGTAMTPLAMGVPQLVAPSGADRYVNAGAVHNRGVGLQVEEEELDARVIRQVLEEDKFRTNAAEVAAEIAAMPSPVDVAAQVEKFVRG